MSFLDLDLLITASDRHCFIIAAVHNHSFAAVQNHSFAAVQNHSFIDAAVHNYRFVFLQYGFLAVCLFNLLVVLMLKSIFDKVDVLL